MKKFFVTMLTVTTVFVQTAYAVCLDPNTLASGYQVPLEEEVQSVEVIAIGKIVESRYLQEDPSDPDGITAIIYTFQVLKELKGQLPEVIELRDENDSGRYWMEVGERHLLFLNWEGQYFKVNSCGNSSLLDKGNDVQIMVEKILDGSTALP